MSTVTCPLSPIAVAFSTPETRSSANSSFCATTPTVASGHSTPMPLAVESDGELSASMDSVPSPPKYIKVDLLPSSAVVATYRHSPYQYQPAPPQPKPTLHGASHQPLLSICEFIAMPQINTIERAQRITTEYPVYLGQAKFEATAAHMRWLIRRMTRNEVLPVAVEPLSPGCFVAFVTSVAEQKAVRKAMHHTVLYDHNGVWHPRTQSERQKVARYMNDREFRMRGQRLPREMVTAELRAPRALASKPCIVLPASLKN